MQNMTNRTTDLRKDEKDSKPTNGLQNLVAYYQSLFDREENIDHYSPDDYQNARRKFVKYLLHNRAI